MRHRLGFLAVALWFTVPQALAHVERDEGGRAAAPPDLRPPRAAQRPRPPPVCRHRDMMILGRTMHNVAPEDDEAIRRTAAELELGVDRLAVAKSHSVSRAFVLHDEKLSQIHITFRGSSSIEDWVTDFVAIPRPAALIKGDENHTETSAIFHAGFYEAALEYKSLIREIRNLVAKRRLRYGDTPRIKLYGHSLGGALSLLLAQFLAEEGLTPDEVVLFATPRVDLGSFADAYRSHTQIWTSHYVVKGDPVPELPPGAGELPVRSTELPPAGVPPGDSPGLEQRFLNHHPDRYVDSLTVACEKERGFRERRLYDSFVTHQKRPPTESEMKHWSQRLFSEDFASLEKTIAGEEATKRQGVKDLFRFLLNREPTEAELLRYTPYLGVYPPTGDHFHHLEAAIKATPEYEALYGE